MNADIDAILVHIGPFIAKRRAELRLSLDDVAERSGCTKSHVWEMEQGRSRNPTIKMALALCDTLQCSLNTLLGVDVSQPRVTDDEMELIAVFRHISKRHPRDSVDGPPMIDGNAMKLTADHVPYSSIVGGGLVLKKPDGGAGFIVNFIGTSEGITKEETAALSDQFAWFVQTYGCAVPERSKAGG